METNYNHISFSGLTTAFLALGLLKSVLVYFKTIRSNKKAKEKKPKQIEVWIASYSSFTSVVTFVGFCTETYYYGARLLMNLVAISIGYIISFAFLQPFFYDMNVKSPYEYLQKRYGNRLIIRIVVAFFGIVFRFSFATLFLWTNATVLATLFPDCPLNIAIIVIGCLSAIYASIGGLIQTTYVSLIQITIFFIGTICAISSAISIPKDKLTYYWNLAEKNNRLKFIETSVDLTVRYTIWNQLFSLPIPWCTFHAILTPHILRYKLIKSKDISSLYMISHLPIMLLVNTTTVFCGIFIYIIFIECDPYLSQKIESKNQIATYFLITVLDKTLPSVAGLSLAVLFSYGIVQHAFGLNFSVELFMNDILKPIYLNWKKENISELKLKIIRPTLVLIISVISIFYAFSFQYVKNSVISLFFLMNTTINAPMTAIIFLSMFNPFANHVGVLISFLIAIGMNLWLGINSVTTSMANPKSQEFYQNTNGCINSTVLRMVNTNTTYTPDNQILFSMYTVSPIWYSLFDFIFIIVFGSLFSLIYSLIVKKRLDLDLEYAKERKKYLFSFRKNFVFIDLCPKKNKEQTESSECGSFVTSF